MTERELKNMYDKMSLSEERISELEKRLGDCFEREPENIGGFDGEELMQFDQEYKPAPRRRNSLRIALTSAAAAVVVAGGVTAAIRTGLIPTGTTVSEPQPEVSTAEADMPLPDKKHGITSADLPDYPNPGALDVESGELRIDSTTFDETCAEDIRSQNIGKTALMAAMTVTDCDYEWGSGDTIYTVTVDKAYYSAMGLDPEGMAIQLLMPGRLRYQYEGCPLYAEGDRFFAALKNGGGMYYEVAAAQTVADLITINDKDYAAVHSKNLPVLSSLSGEEVLTYPRTVTLNPAKYYGLYDLDEFGEYYAEIAGNADKPEFTTDDRTNVTLLSFYSDAQVLETIFEPNFFGCWRSEVPGISRDFDLEYTVQSDDRDIFRPMRGFTCGGFSMDDKAFYMLDFTDGAQLWCIWKDEPGRLYHYDSLSPRNRSEYTAAYTLEQSATVSTVTAPARVSQLGLLKVLSDYGDSIEVRALHDKPSYNDGSLKGSITAAVMDVLENGTAEYAGSTWQRLDVSQAEYQDIVIPQEVNWILEKSADKFSMTLRLFNADEKWRGLRYGEAYSGEICRYFRADFAKLQDGTWECSGLTPMSGDTSDMGGFFSPLTDIDMYCSYINSGDISPEVSVEYYAVPNNGSTDIYALRTLKNVFEGVDEQGLYYRDPRTDEYRLLTYGETLGFTVEDDSVIAASVIDGSVVVTRYRGGFAKERTYAGSGANSDSLELIPHGEFVLVGYSVDSGEFYTEYYSVIERTNLFVEGCYEKRLLKISGDGIEYYNEYSDSYHEINVTDKTLIRGIDEKAQKLWSEYDISAPSGTGDYLEIDDHTVRAIADPEHRSYDGILKQFLEVYTPEAAQEAMNAVVGQSVIVSDGAAYTTEGARGADISVWGVGFVILDETFTENSVVLDYAIYYADPIPSDHYTINAVKTADGWRLDRFYYPY